MPSSSTIAQMSADDRLKLALSQFDISKLKTLKPLLPLLLNLRGEPYTIDKHQPFEPFFNVNLPRRLVIKSARQLSKSTSLAARGIIQACCIPWYNILFVTPIFEMSRRFSSNYVRTFIDGSPVKKLYVDASCNQSVMQRGFRNNSSMFFGACFDSADRLRGINSSAIVVDEIQDFDLDFLPIIEESMSGFDYPTSAFAGTPKSFDGPLQVLFEQSSQAEWVVKCEACNYYNIPALEFDLDAMTGPDVVTREVSEAAPGVVCAKCGRPIFPGTGRWIHRFPDRRASFSGYHLPQICLPMHYANAEKWGAILGKRRGHGNISYPTYVNEVVGESYDVGTKLVSIADLKRAAVLHRNEFNTAAATIGNYTSRVLSVDWGHAGEDMTSFTTAVVLGVLPDGKVDVIFGWRSLEPNNHIGEAQRLIKLLYAFQCDYMVHDFGGAGNLRETVMVNSGIPLSLLMPVSYIRATSGPLFRYIPENELTQLRGHYRCDKARSLVLTCNLIKTGFVRFFAYDYVSPENPGILHDFLALTESNVESKTKGNIYTIIRNSRVGPDDAAQATNIGLCSIFHRMGHWPEITTVSGLELTPEQSAYIGNPENLNW